MIRRRNAAILAAAAAALLAIAPVDGLRAEEAEITFVMVNDLDRMGEDNGRGGFARLAAVVGAERAKGGNVIFAHGGDAISPSLLSGFDKGAHIIELLNEIRPDVMVLGNHEFDFGPAVLRRRLSEATFDILAGNVREPDGKPLAGTRDTKMFELGGFRIGVLGVTSQDSYEKSSPGNLEIGDVPTRIRELAGDLDEAGADFIVVLAHVDIEEDLDLVRAGVADMILSGDDHHLLTYFDGRTILVESSSQANYVTAIDVSLTRSGEGAEAEVEWSPGFRIIDTATVTPDPEIAKIVAGYESKLDKELNVEIGTTEVELDTRRTSVRSRETVFGDIVADAMREVTGADVAIINGGGIRGDRIYPAGTRLTRRDILTELPFGNTTVSFEITGEGLLKALENGFSQVESGGGRFPQVSGMTVEIDLAKPVGFRVVSAMVGGKPVARGATYKVATNNFMARGGDGYASFAEVWGTEDAAYGKLTATDVIEHIEKLGTIDMTAGSRIVQ